MEFEHISLYCALLILQYLLHTFCWLDIPGRCGFKIKWLQHNIEEIKEIVKIDYTWVLIVIKNTKDILPKSFGYDQKTW